MKQKFKKLFLRCTFSEKEMADIALTMADKTQELKRIDANANAAAAQFKSDKEAAQNEVDGAARKYRDGYEMRDVECEETVDFESGVVRYWRCDNGDLAQERKLTNEERQMRLDEIEVEKELNPPALPAPDEDATHHEPGTGSASVKTTQRKTNVKRHNEPGRNRQVCSGKIRRTAENLQQWYY